MLKRDDLSGAEAALKGISTQYELLMDGRLKDTPAVANLHDLLVEQLNVASNARAAASQREREEAERRASQGVTARNYARLRTGMTYDEVVEILGREGTELSRSDLAGISTVMYSWQQGKTGLGRNMNAMFQDDRLVMKAQYGLR